MYWTNMSVSRAARDKYGVVLTGSLDDYDLEVDVAATAALRQHMKAAQAA
jgi:N-methylhydantoinase B